MNMYFQNYPQQKGGKRKNATNNKKEEERIKKLESRTLSWKLSSKNQQIVYYIEKDEINVPIALSAFRDGDQGPSKVTKTGWYII